MTSKPIPIPIGSKVRILAGSNFGKTGRVVRGLPPAPRGYVYVELEGHLPGTSVLVAIVSCEVVP